MEEDYFEINADEITVEVKDAKTGQIFRRELPIEYYENANLLRLRGEHMDGSLSELVFYSSRGIQRLKDLTGYGADHDGCADN